MRALVDDRADAGDDDASVGAEPAPAGSPTSAPAADEPDADDDGRPVADEPDDDDGPAAVTADDAGEPARPGSGSTEIVQETDEPPVPLRVDFGAHFEANYQRLVAQLYAITLDPGQAHDAVQDAYSRAWRRWDTVGATSDPSAWIRSVAVRSTIRSWRNMFTRIGIGRPRPMEWDVEPRTAAMLTALHRLPIPERRAIVLSYMAGVSAPEIAAIDETSLGSVQARLSRGRRLMTVSLADDLPVVLGMISGGGGGDYDEEYR